MGPARAGFFGPGRTTLGAHFGGVDGDHRSAWCLLLKTAPDGTLKLVSWGIRLLLKRPSSRDKFYHLHLHRRRLTLGLALTLRVIHDVRFRGRGLSYT